MRSISITVLRPIFSCMKSLLTNRNSFIDNRSTITGVSIWIWNSETTGFIGSWYKSPTRLSFCSSRRTCCGSRRLFVITTKPTAIVGRLKHFRSPSVSPPTVDRPNHSPRYAHTPRFRYWCSGNPREGARVSIIKRQSFRSVRGPVGF